jgi:hypothetical protein
MKLPELERELPRSFAALLVKTTEPIFDQRRGG